MTSPTPEQFLAAFPPPAQALAQRLRRLVGQALPESSEEVRLGWHLIAFYMPGRPRPIYTGFIIPHPDYVTLGFAYGALLDDPDGRLLGAAEKLKRVRYLTFHSARDIRPAVLTPLIRRAAAIAQMPADLRAQMQSAARRREKLSKD
jgi:hypothetical protein